MKVSSLPDGSGRASNLAVEFGQLTVVLALLGLLKLSLAPQTCGDTRSARVRW